MLWRRRRAAIAIVEPRRANPAPVVSRRVESEPVAGRAGLVPSAVGSGVGPSLLTAVMVPWLSSENHMLSVMGLPVGSVAVAVTS